MDLILHQIVSGIATGAVYALLALAIVTVYQASGQFNFAQGEMAMFSTFIAWQLMQKGVPYWLAFTITLAVSFVAALAIEQILFRPIRSASAFAHIVVFVALYSILNSVAGFLWDYTVKTFPSPFGTHVFGNGLISLHEAGMIAVALGLLLLMYLFFCHTRLGLAMRAATANPDSARLVGIRVGSMIAVGWGMAAMIGAASGILIAPIVFLEPNMMAGVLLYGFAGAVIGGLTSPAGAVGGGFLVGIIENLAGTIPGIGPELKLTVALVLIVAMLVIMPSGICGRKDASRV
jgi:branched-chain amino acid transport system permease protein